MTLSSYSSRISQLAKGRLRERFPGAASTYKQVVRPLLQRRTPTARMDRWVSDGVALLEQQGVRAIEVTDHEAWLVEPDGLSWLYLDGRSSLLSLKEGRPHEPAELDLLAQRLADGGSLLDVGANIGYVTVRLAKQLPQLRAVAIEPVPAVHEALRANIARNGVADRVEPVHAAAAAAAERGSSRITVDRGPANYVLQDGTTRGAGAVDVPARRIDDIVAERGPLAISVVKCDVEGAELLALRGAENLLQAEMPALLLEVEERWTRRFGYMPTELFNFLSERGYARHLVLPSGEVRPGGDPATDLAATNSFWFVPG